MASHKRALRTIRFELHCALKESDVGRGEAAIDSLRKWVKENPGRAWMEVAGLGRLVLEFESMRQLGAVVSNPDEKIEEIHQALDAQDPKRAGEIMRSLTGSWAAGGPRPSKEGKKRVLEALVRADWGVSCTE